MQKNIISGPLSFSSLVRSITATHENYQQQAAKAVNLSLTIRNWLIGYYIVEFEQNGADRASYGNALIEKIAKKISIQGLGTTNLKLVRLFYQKYKHLGLSVQKFLPENRRIEIRQLPTDELSGFHTKYETDLLTKVSFTHFVELLKIEDSAKRKFFEMLAIRTTPSVKELKRQIHTLAFERIGMSKDMKSANYELLNKITPAKAVDAIKSVYAFDFLGLQHGAFIEENKLEAALIQNLQLFLHELGQGFCFEQRQKRILIDDEYYFADLVFYHRILKCHVIIELKVDAFKPEYLSQLNTYVSYYNAEIKRLDDNPAIGILLCTSKGKKLVEYATAGMDNRLFVSKYLFSLPQKEKLEEFIINESKSWNEN